MGTDAKEFNLGRGGSATAAAFRVVRVFRGSESDLFDFSFLLLITGRLSPNPFIQQSTNPEFAQSRRSWH